MESILVKFKAEQQQLTNTGTKQFASNTVAYIYAEFDLGENWAGFDVVRAVWKTEFSQIATVLDGSGRCAIPAEVLNKCGQNVFVNLVGSIADGDELTDRLTTYQCKALTIDKPAFVDGSETAPITPSQFEQFAEVVHNDAEAASDARDEARGYASDAEGYRDEAVGAAADAKDYRDAAKGYADDAEGYKDQAKGYADDAEADAEEIRNMSATATTLPEGSSATASYADGVLSLGIPKGDTGATGPEGPTGPQGPTGPTGNGIASVTLKSTSGAVKTYEILFTDGTTTTFNVTDGEVTLAELASVLPTDTASGAIASFPDGSDLFDYLSCIVDIEPVQAGSGTPSPDNVRPITGWTGCEVDVAGVNLLDASLIEQGSYDFPSSAQNCNTTYIPIKGGQTYMWSQNGSVAGRYIRFYDSEYTEQDTATRVTQYNTTNATFSAPQWAKFMRILWYSVNSITPTDIKALQPQIEPGSTATPYQTYNPNSAVYPITWQTEAGTVYGGTVDLATGVLTVTDGHVDLGTLNWTRVQYQSDFYYFRAPLTGLYVTSSGNDAPMLLCSSYACANKTQTSALSSDKLITKYFNNINLLVRDDSYTTGESFTTAVSGVYLVYRLATPTTYQLDPVQVACLLGQNNVWADCGDIDEVKYKADVQLYIDKRLGA